MRRTGAWLLWVVISSVGCALVGYDFGDYAPEGAGGSGGGGAGPAGSSGSATTGSLASSGSGPAHCTDSVQNNGETGVDCGGPCPACPCAISFPTRVDIDVTGSSFGVHVTDIDADGHLDILAVSHTANLTTVLRGDGTGQFAAAVIPGAMGSSPYAVTSADFNYDGAMDFAVTNHGTSSVDVFLNQGGTFPAQSVSVPMGPWGIDRADLNGDNNIDLVVCSTTANLVSLMMGNGSGSFTAGAQVSLPPGSSPVAVAVGDLDGDSNLDIVIANRDSEILTIVLNDGTGNYIAAQTYLAPGPIQIALADYNNDGVLDIAASSSTSLGATLLLGQGNGTFQPVMDALPCGMATGGIVAADFNGDGNMDVAVAAAPMSNLFVFAGKGDGSFQAPLAVANLTNSVSLAAGDFSGDDKPDLVAGSVDQPLLAVFLNGCL